MQVSGRVETGTQSQFRTLVVTFLLPPTSPLERGIWGAVVCIFVCLYVCMHAKLHTAACPSICGADIGTWRFVDQ